MGYRFEFRPYRRPFRQPLQTHHGLWQIREGIILRLSDAAGQVALGEIAPIDWFGSESLNQALRFCQGLPVEIETETIASIPAQLPACQFGFQSAWEVLSVPTLPPKLPLICSSLLPTGRAALRAWRSRWQTGYTTFKWKIGVAPVEEELAIFKQLAAALPSSAKLRLDANGGLNWDTACRWLEACEVYPMIEFLEQPLPVTQIESMQRLSQQYATAIALDESIATLKQLEACYQQGWHGIFVIKPAIAGSPQQLREFCQTFKIDVVWSSVFETTVAQRFIHTYLIAALPGTPRAAGFGVNSWFADNFEQQNLEQLWQTL